MFKLIPLLMTYLSVVALFIWNPLIMGITIILQTILICSYNNFMNNMPWFSYILMLVFLGGILILFAYMTIIASNSIINIKINLLIMSLVIFIILFFMYNPQINIQFNLNNELKSLLNTINLNKMKFNINKLFNNYTYLINLILMNYLFLMLITSNKITNIFQGPLRSLN
uniref:NADH dehydrogenase subunit 6 n=1 Tax=Hydroptila sp. XG-2021 TaxID=2996735 RepID=A0A9E8LPR1_9NEOP|nr:NADH dehydrogenase subunit 6 [Hydroptila sp. XG-2021]